MLPLTKISFIGIYDALTAQLLPDMSFPSAHSLYYFFAAKPPSEFVVSSNIALNEFYYCATATQQNHCYFKKVTTPNVIILIATSQQQHSTHTGEGRQRSASAAHYAHDYIKNTKYKLESSKLFFLMEHLRYACYKNDRRVIKKIFLRPQEFCSTSPPAGRISVLHSDVLTLQAILFVAEQQVVERGESLEQAKDITEALVESTTRFRNSTMTPPARRIGCFPCRFRQRTLSEEIVSVVMPGPGLP